MWILKTILKKLELHLFGTLLISFLLLSAFACSGLCYASTPTNNQSQTIEMSMEQYSRLKQITETQDARLEMLSQKLTLLQKNSTEASKALIEANSELTKQKNDLIETRKQLETANLSLTKAEEILKKQETSIDKLTKKIKSLEHKQAVVRRQRDIWMITAGGLLAWGVCK